ncbi:MAG: DUF72 domain-containing protein [Candidatus Bathyarchaeia archaeon]
MGKLLLGCSGWYYKDWVGPFYREEARSKLAAYSKVFKTAEIDSTFYAYPSKGTVMGWLKYTKPDFIYSAKLPRLITHKKKLDLKKGVDKDMQRFCDLMEPLQLDGKLGCLLAQLPPDLKFDLPLMESFLSVFPSRFKLAVEFRDASWLRDETWRLLERYNVAYTIVDEPLLPPDVKVTSDIAYIRWHGRGKYPWYNYHYKTEELEQWVPKVEETVNKAETTFGYFNNHYHAYAVKNCFEMMDMLGIITPQQKEVKKTVKEYLEARPKAPPPKPSLALTAFMPEEINRMSFKDLLRIFMDNRRIKRAKGIKDEEVKLQEVTSDHVKATVRRYHVAIDVSNRLILHDCADWSRCAPVKQFCKHVGKVLMSMPEEEALSILRRIGTERGKWEFKPYVA